MARYLNGTVVSDKADKTIVISTRTRKTHPIYKKQYTVTTRFTAHDEENEAKVGDKVVIIETRPLSATKRFRLDKIIERAGARFEEKDATADIPEEDLAKQSPKPDKKVPAPKEKDAKEKPA